MRRLDGSVLWQPTPDAAVASAGRPLAAYLRLGEGAERALIYCLCGQPLGAAGENFKTHSMVKESPLQEAGPHVDPYDLGKGKFVFRQFFCPSCAVLLETEVTLQGSPYEWDIEVY